MTTIAMVARDGRAAEGDPFGEVLVLNLGIGSGQGCRANFVPVPDTDLVDTLKQLRTDNELSPELVAICDPYTMSQSGATGSGSNSSPQSTKNATQFDPSRSRVPRRLRRSSLNDDGAVVLAALDTDATMITKPEANDGLGWEVYGSAEYEHLRRAKTPFEGGFSGNRDAALVGADYGWSNAVAGAWAKWSNLDADMTPGGAIAFRQGVNAEQPDFLNSEHDLTLLCGALPGQGNTEEKGYQVGAYGGLRIGQHGFAIAQVDYGHRDYSYNRAECAILVPSGGGPDDPFRVTEGGTLYVDRGNDSPLAPGDNDIVGDHIFSGRIRGDTTIEEFGVTARIGADFPVGDFVITPQTSLGYRRVSIDAFTERGNSLINNTVKTDDLGDIPFNSATPSGLEISYDKQERESLRLDVGALIQVPLETSFGSISPYVGATWRHEFDDDPDTVTFRMAGDHRAQPLKMTYALDAPDSDDVVLTGGVAVQIGDDVSTGVEVSYVAYNDQIESTTVTAGLRIRF